MSMGYTGFHLVFHFGGRGGGGQQQRMVNKDGGGGGGDIWLYIGA